MAGCCTGSEIDLKEMRTPGQKDVGNILGPLIAAGIGQGATPFGGQLSQGPDQAQMAAMNTMMGIGGKGQYQQQQYPQYAWQGYGGGPIGPSGTTGETGTTGVYVNLTTKEFPNILNPGPTGTTGVYVNLTVNEFPNILNPGPGVYPKFTPKSNPSFPNILNPGPVGNNVGQGGVGQGGNPYDPYQSY